jgi:hypothetical protein
MSDPSETAAAVATLARWSGIVSAVGVGLTTYGLSRNWALATGLAILALVAGTAAAAIAGMWFLAWTKLNTAAPKEDGE